MVQIPELGALLRSKAITSMELTQLYLQRLRRWETPHFNGEVAAILTSMTPTCEASTARPCMRAGVHHLESHCCRLRILGHPRLFVRFDKCFTACRYDPYLEFVVTYTEDLAYSQAAHADTMFSEVGILLLFLQSYISSL